ncbi:putative transmembrane anti-sigma factor [Mycobacteroides abscessus subsp. massiliense]|uniref:Transmembrane anti-sigma factor n=2 Tax=Mycobacteroides abscessus subsp. bolletii TaxID=319705 RepID=A0A9Q7SHZ4_9MYCO|nr:zf-HC2 domain-containing protein [Mycobacteroides abscessus]EUA69408.1 zinc-finger family protein [Mycobacteroides abscessus subsp. bolletii 1513]AMU21082.1 anti-sigma factor [Mycobacteroides abscessus]EHM21286.1 hypothetical protein MBOL_19750 [Mycobacteroides abscessus subsp. bolletii BD]EIU14711.1 hypothetical protein MA5S0304_1020 [Mycobacteroides abscessus 5S-0304]EIU15667.1 hypothetical protein MA5S0421_1301 [Mycobacteroides abscessus 5S-0421]
MTIEHVYADWDAAYVLGALSSAERREYEQHLVDCVSCQRALSEVTAMPGLLSKVDRGYAEKMELEDPPVLAKPATSCPVQALWPKLQARWRRQSAVRRLAYVGAVAVAAAVALTVSLVPPPWYHRPAPMNVAAGSLPAGEHWQPMRQVTPSPLSAQVALVRDGTGTRIEMWCSYPVYGDDADDSAAAPYALRIGTRTGQSIIASSWTAKPGSTLMTSTTVPMAQDQIERIQVIDNHGDASPLVFLELHH